MSGSPTGSASGPLIGSAKAQVRNLHTGHRTLARGLTLYRTNRSPFWMVRLWCPVRQGYVVRSSKLASMGEAMRYAYEFRDSYKPLQDGIQGSRHHRPRVGTRERTREQDTPSVTVSLVQQADPTPSPQAIPLVPTPTASRADNNLSFYLDRFITLGLANKDDLKIIKRPVDGIAAYFGGMDIGTITTQTIREYYSQLDHNRDKPLVATTKDKQGMVLRKIMRLAFEGRVIPSLPDLPNLKTEDKPPPSFTDLEFTKLVQTAKDCAARGDTVRGVTVTREHVDMILFTVSSFVRPTVTELFGLRIKDITVKDNPSCLVLSLDGKTGKRTSVTMADAVDIFNRADIDNNEYLFMDEYKNRQTAINTFRRVFNHILDKSELKIDHEGNERTPYSLRHTGLQKRLSGSAGKVNIFNLAKNAGTSVEMLQRFYLKKAIMTDAEIRNLIE